METLNISNDSICLISKSIADSPFFVTLLSLEAVFGLLALIPNLVLAYVVVHALIYPANLRFLLSHLSLNIAWYSLGNSIKIFDMLIKSRTWCGLVVSAYHCRLAELPLTIPSGNVFYSLMALCLERLFCSIRYRTYDQEASKPWIAFLFLTIIWTGSLAGNLFSLPLIPRDKFVPVCESMLSIGANDAFKGLLSSVILELIALVLIICINAYDKRKMCHAALNRAKYTLTERFQINQCVQIDAMLVPSVILHGVCFMPYMILLMLVSFGINIEAELKWSLFHLVFIYRMIYSISHPLLAFGRNPRLRQHLIKNMPKFLIDIRDRWLSKKKSGEQQPNITAHFNVLDRFWATPTGKVVKIKPKPV